jgi:hypothetical protein
MKIYADVKIRWANETDKKKIFNLINKSEGAKLPFLTSKLFPSKLRFGDKFDISNPGPDVSEFEFQVYGVCDAENK